ncbi:lytic transglycosylase domain-containing protein [Mameliella sp. AT18]|uniref:lytic transglycosylase domain-containing protein n=1 Tax=Mameliella sp. AT18 TaxID=3028385 RepID=UPI00237AB223|nr:lytic transglycosylase domain-containing protein [Mameliella sp. AT18]MDD9732812.1 lytic transglycosylase domain-containing protein [Mameliella sp. AT18]
MSRMQNQTKPRNAAGRLGTTRRTGLLLLSGLLSLGSLPAIAPAHARAENTSRCEQSAAHPFAAHIAEASHRFGLPEHWIRAVMTAESDGIARAISSKGAMGLMQIMPDTWIELSARYRLGNDPFDPRGNILAGAAYLRELHDKYGSPGFLAAYNAGPGRYGEYLVGGRPLPAETRNYVAALAPYVDASAASLAAIPVQINRSDWTQSPLFVAQANGGATAVSEPALVEPVTATEMPIEETDKRLAPRDSGLFVTPLQAHGRQ